MNDSSERLLRSFNGNPPTQAAAVAQTESKLGIKLPLQYVAFTLATNGGEGFIGPHSYTVLWRVEELAEQNEAYKVSEFAPGLVLFGSDGGGEAFAFDSRPGKDLEIVAVPFVVMDLVDARVVAANFDGFLEALYRS